ncbi:glycosyltransferase [Herpetosiphon gulosus]|uniref:O-mycaminosyltylonolide 6-deoxyallosyltransferase n=1 Tax=Herpetosiphon gulosus TaxID=1973496 RepID=A0ABP9WY68_9CHLR
MRILIIAFGTRGDVQPMVALGLALQQRGHSITLLVSSNFKSWVEEFGLQVATARVDIQQMMLSDHGNDWVKHGANPIKQRNAMRRLLKQHALTMVEDAWQAAQNCDVLISSFTSDVFAVTLAEVLKVLHISTPLQPAMLATRCGPASAAAILPNHDNIINYWFGRWVIEPFMWQVGGDFINQFRQQQLKLPAQSVREYTERLRQTTMIQGYSSAIIPHPSDWPANIQTVGYWMLPPDEAWQMPPELEQFLADGPTPIYIGFGSMTGANPDAFTELLLKAVAHSGQRAIIQTGWAGLGQIELPKTVFRIGAAPHERLFRHVKAAVHHGGAGTTAASLAAGLPTVIVPHLGDQLRWGQRVYDLGLGPKAIPRNKLTVDRLAWAISQASNTPSMQHNAQAMAKTLQAEQGISCAVEIIEQRMQA